MAKIFGFLCLVAVAVVATVSGSSVSLSHGDTSSNSDPSYSIVVGDVRVSALSETLVRVEPKGSKGFEDRTTFMVVNRNWTGIPITLKQSTPHPVLSTQYYDVTLTGATPNPTPPPPPVTCANPKTNTDVTGGARTKEHRDGANVADKDACCAICDGDADCVAWVFATNSVNNKSQTTAEPNCWAMATYGDTKTAAGRTFGCPKEGCKAPQPTGVDIPGILITSPDGKVIFNSSQYNNNKNVQCGAMAKAMCTTPCFWDKDSSKCENQQPKNNLLHFPGPMTSAAYPLVDYPRFFAPEWGPTPIPADATVDPALVATNGYDFTNNVEGDTYIFLLGSTLESYHSSRKEFVELAGPCPVLPDFAFGTWFTYWYRYSETQAKSEVSQWISDNLPIDVWALDMNWRNTSNHQDWYYNHPDTNLFPDFTEWFAYLKGKKLRTYFNDHPYPVASRNAGGLQTSPEEVAFRWEGLSKWMSQGLTYWWFDHNWGFSIPPPFVNTSVTSGNWEGLDNAAWGSHVYHTTVKVYDQMRAKAGDMWFDRPITLTKFGIPDWRPGMPAVGHQESPAQHRYPVWWTGDGVPLQGSVESMVDCGVHDFKPYVHSDCGGDYRTKTGGDLLRWTAHCAFGSIHRFHGNDHRPWSYTPAVEDTIRSYLKTRYSMAPSLVSAGQMSAETGFPFVTRADLLWPEYANASDNTQYVFINDTLVAPIWETDNNITNRSVWVPPGEWEDVWDGSKVTGPMQMTTRGYPFEQQPMWHRSGGLIVTTSEPGVRIDDQDWSTLTLDAYPSSQPFTTERSVFALKTAVRTDLVFEQTASSEAALKISTAADGSARAWVLRVHLNKGQSVITASIDGVAVNNVVHIKPVTTTVGFFPLGGAGSAPAINAGSVAEIHVSSGSDARVVKFHIE